MKRKVSKHPRPESISGIELSAFTGSYIDLYLSFWYIVIYTFSDASLADVNPPVFLPRGFSLANYKDIFTLDGFSTPWGCLP